MWFVWMMWGLTTSLLYAEECDEQEIKKVWETPKSDALASAVLSLVSCAPEKERLWVQEVIPKLETNRLGIQVLKRALVIGLDDPVEEFVLSLLPTERDEVLQSISTECSEHKPVADFLYTMLQKRSLEFWSDRWDVAIRRCMDERILERVRAQVLKGKRQGESRYIESIKTYIHMDSAKAFSILRSLVQSTTGIEQIQYIDLYTEVLNIQSDQETKEKHRRTAIDEVISLAALFTGDSVDKLRRVLHELDARIESQQLVRYRYHDFIQDDGSLFWGGIVFETALCANNRYQQKIHFVLMIDQDAILWSDQLEATLREKADEWRFSVAKKCKGKEERTYIVPHNPFLREEDWNQWCIEQKELARLENRILGESTEVQEETFIHTKEKIEIESINEKEEEKKP